MNKNNETKGIKLFTEGTVKIGKGEREFTRLYGGFGENQPVITIKQIGQLLGKEDKHVTERIKDNIKYFEDGVHLLDLKVVGQSDHYREVLKTLGYNTMAISKSKNIYILSEAGFILYLKFAEGEKSVELFKDFIEDYFRLRVENVLLKTTLEDEIAFLKGEKSSFIGKMVMAETEQERIELTMQIERYNNKLSELKSALDNKAIKTALDNQSKLKISKKEYVNQADFGARFNNKIGSKTVGKLFKVVGLAKKTYNKTTPYEQYIPKYAQNDVDNETEKRFDVSYKWSYNECIKFIDKWLIEQNIYEEFYSITNKIQLTKYINTLYEKQINKAS